MTQVLSLAPQYTDAASAHPHMDLDRAVRASGSQSVFAPRRSPSPGTSSFTRERSVSLNSEQTAHGMYEQLRINTSTAAMKPEGARDAICLCTPTPKIPRPRNAFILYRQHHQSQVTADNPKLSNPEISKIIGEKWKHEDEDVKETWKKLAEEEKQRHQHQYPNYRYQPRRGSKAQGSWPNTPSGEEPGRCMKCNGRSIATPRTPSTPVATPPSAQQGVGSQTQPGVARLDTSSTPRRLSLELSPVSALPHPVSALPHPHHLPPVRSMEDDPTSPGIKRRRANGAGNYHTVGRLHGGFGDAQSDPMRTSPETGSFPAMRPYTNTGLPEISMIPRSHSGPMPPPPRPPGAPWVENERMRRQSGFDESLRLPPLQTTTSPVRAAPNVDRQPPMLPSPIFNLPPTQEARPSNPEETIMSIPFMRKLSLLSHICRPLPVSGQGQPSETRGAVIAVEGSQSDMLQDVGQAVEKVLQACDEVALRTWIPDTTRPLETPKSESDAMFPSYFRTVMSWQEKAKEMKSYVTRGDGINSPSVSKPLADTGSEIAKGKERVAPTSETVPSNKMPVALIKEGYSLTMSDKFACSLPISDSYTPQDHWKWMATLWRGTPCPDLVIYALPSDEDEMKKFGTVEISKRMGLITVRTPKGQSLDEATERRLAFELIEWTRDGSFRMEVPVNWRDQ